MFAADEAKPTIDPAKDIESMLACESSCLATVGRE